MWFLHLSKIGPWDFRAICSFECFVMGSDLRSLTSCPSFRVGLYLGLEVLKCYLI
jgi:hypothetical protein